VDTTTTSSDVTKAPTDARISVAATRRRGPAAGITDVADKTFLRSVASLPPEQDGPPMEISRTGRSRRPGADDFALPRGSTYAGALSRRMN
jgi:hypothetical protein